DALGLLQTEVREQRSELPPATPAGQIGEHRSANRQVMVNIGDIEYVSYLHVGGQTIAGILDTGSFELVVFSTECKTCGTAAKYNPKLSKTHKPGALMTVQSYGSGDTYSWEAKDTVSIGPFDAKNQTFWEEPCAPPVPVACWPGWRRGRPARPLEPRPGLGRAPRGRLRLPGDRRPHADPPQRGIPGHHRHRAARDSRGGRLDGGAEVAGVREQVLRRQQAPPKGRPEGREGRHRVRAGDERHAPDAAHLRRAGLLHLHGGPCRLRRVLHLAGASAHGQARPLHEGAHPREAHLERWPRQREAHAPGPLHGDPAGLLRGGRLQRAHRQRHQPSRRAPPRHQQGAGPRGQDARGLPG
ncbi:unnamed protein product, partial [Prorocentrum cordatum]